MLAPCLQPRIHTPPRRSSVRLVGRSSTSLSGIRSNRGRACPSPGRVIELVPPSDPYIVPRGVGVELQIHVPPGELSGLFLLHRAAGVVFSELRERRPGERGFRAEIIGYHFPFSVVILTPIWP